MARFEDYRDSVKKELYDNTVQAAMKAMRDRLGSMALASLRIRDPVLAQQWAEESATKTARSRAMRKSARNWIKSMRRPNPTVRTPGDQAGHRHLNVSAQSAFRSNLFFA